MPRIKFLRQEEFVRVADSVKNRHDRLSLLADMCRANTLAAVKRAGSGHLGTSLSAMDIVVWLYYGVMNTTEIRLVDPNRDVYFSSKGHDVPGLYSVLYALGVIPEDRFLRLRRLHGLDGHPDVGVPGIEANSGSLGMGISKGRGIAWAKRHFSRSGQVFVMVGDGEFQEGQNFEALQSTVQQGITDLTVIMDHNKVQSDKPVDQIVSLQDLQRKLSSFGWHVVRCNGNDTRSLDVALSELREVTDRPKFLIADTLKGRGVSFMEHPYALDHAHGCYPWHAGAPDDKSYERAQDEVMSRIQVATDRLGLARVTLFEPEAPEHLVGQPLSVQNTLGEPVSLALRKEFGRATAEYVAQAYGDALCDLAEEHPEVIVLDGDLAADCRIRAFENKYPDRFIQNGIAEQDMVSMAGGLARQGLLPVVNSFASFLASRANEQIYNNNTEKSRIIYACHYGGLIPAGPGKSHQSLRDVSLFAALPNCLIIQPCNAEETRLAVEFAIKTASENCVLRFVIGPSPRKIVLPVHYSFSPGHGTILFDGNDAVLFAYGPVMLHEALLAAELLAAEGFGLCVVNMPWLNHVSSPWLAELICDFQQIYVLEDHSSIGALGDALLRTMARERLLDGRTIDVFGIDEYPACGTPAEVLRFHRLDGESLATTILTRRDRRVTRVLNNSDK